MGSSVDSEGRWQPSRGGGAEPIVVHLTIGRSALLSSLSLIRLYLALSFQAADAAPVIMMSQNLQQEIDRKAAENDYRINVKAETRDRVAA
jgi:hypothetical protein